MHANEAHIQETDQINRANTIQAWTEEV